MMGGQTHTLNLEPFSHCTTEEADPENWISHPTATHLQALAKVVRAELLQRQGVQGLGAVGGGAGVQLHPAGVVRMLVHSRVVGQRAQRVGLAQGWIGAGLQA